MREAIRLNICAAFCYTSGSEQLERQLTKGGGGKDNNQPEFQGFSDPPQISTHQLFISCPGIQDEAEVTSKRGESKTKRLDWKNEN